MFRLIIGEALGLVAISFVFGLYGVYGAARLLRSMLYRVTAADPFTFSAIVCLITLVTVIAAWLPARRAARIDPISALRAG